jgi:hypothetical protein
VEDGFIIMYVKGGVVYPVAMTEEEHTMLQMIGPSLFKDKKVRLIDKPQGKVTNLTEGK